MCLYAVLPPLFCASTAPIGHQIGRSCCSFFAGVNLAPLYGSFFIFFSFLIQLYHIFFCVSFCILLRVHRCRCWGTLIISATTISGRTLGCSSSSSKELEESSESWSTADDAASFSCHPFLPLFALNFLIDT